MELQYTIIIAVIGFISAFISGISGGGGLLAIPTFLALGIPPINALALNRLSDLGLVIGASRNYFKIKKIDWRLFAYAAILLAVGNFIGANVIVALPNYIVSWAIIGVSLIGIAIVLSPKIGKLEKNKHKKISTPLFIAGLSLIFFGGIWGGAIAIADATVGMLVITYFFRKNFLEARALELFSSMPGTFISTVILVNASTLQLMHMSVIVVASIAGAFVGSLFNIRTDGKTIRYLMAVIAMLVLTKVAFDLLLGTRLVD